MKNVVKAIGLGVLAGIVVGGYMSWRKGKKLEEKIDETFNDDFINDVCDKTVDGLHKINEEVQENIQKSFDELGKTKNDVLNNIKERHEKLNEEIEKMKKDAEDLEKAVKESHEVKDEIVPPVVEEIKITEEEKLQHEKNMKILKETEDQIDNILNDLNK